MSIHIYHERPGQTTIRSQISLPDRQNRTWQATLFKRYEAGALTGTYLRLVAFPGLVAIAADQPLEIETGTGVRWRAPASTASLPQSLPENVVQYDLQAVLRNLQAAIPLTLQVPLQHGLSATLVAAPFVVEEWLQLAAMEEPS